MNNVNLNDFIGSDSYRRFITLNPGEGYLRIRAYAASGAIPIEGLRIVVSKDIDNQNVIFFEGETDESGMIDRISLPAPITDKNNLVAPEAATYNISSTYTPNNTTERFNVSMYDGICVMQNISIVPNVGSGRYYYGS